MFGEGAQAKNIFVLDNPLPTDADFVDTTCLEGFEPTTFWQLAGLILYDDDDNYLKWDYEYSHVGRRVLCLLTEVAQKSTIELAAAPDDVQKLWLRIARRGRHYQCSISQDGMRFELKLERDWDVLPRGIGLIAKNGGNKVAGEIPAVFNFFALRSSSEPAAEKERPQ